MNLYNKKYLDADHNDISYKIITHIALVLLGIMALFASSQLSIPVKPIPITGQTIVISLIGLTYSPRLAFITVLAYISAGVLGLPIFIKFSSGLQHITGLTGGYLLGLLIAAPIMAIIKSKIAKQAHQIIACCLIGHLIIYLLGTLWLTTFIGWQQALLSGFIIYIPTDLLKIIIFAALFSYINNKVATNSCNG